VALSANDLAYMQSTNESLMADACVIQTHSASRDATGEEQHSYTDGDTISCGFHYANRQNRRDADMTLQVTAGVFRLSLGTTINRQDHIKLTHKYGTALGTAIEFELDGLPIPGPSALVVPVRKVEA